MKNILAVLQLYFPKDLVYDLLTGINSGILCFLLVTNGFYAIAVFYFCILAIGFILAPILAERDNFFFARAQSENSFFFIFLSPLGKINYFYGEWNLMKRFLNKELDWKEQFLFSAPLLFAGNLLVVFNALVGTADRIRGLIEDLIQKNK
jgi:hypothetical protein